jgi:hypothetical protein
LTGVEAISNGITAFKKPRSHNAAITLTWMTSILVVLFLGITLLANAVHALPSETETIISQLGHAIYGDGSVMHLVLLAGTAIILLLAANTSYAGFPRLAALQAGDGYLPRQLTYRGSRLVFSWGIVGLALFAALLVIVLDARTTALIPLYAIGVFLSFTISQAGMVVHQWKIGKLKPGETIQGIETTLVYDKNWGLKMFFSAFGAVCTFIVMMVFAITKFTSGAWFIVVLIPSLVFLFFRIHRHYKDVAHSLSLAGIRPDVEPRAIQTLILVDDVHAETARLVNFAKSLRHPWKAVHVGVNPEKAEVVKKKWQERIGEGELVIISSPFRLLAEPIQHYIEELQTEKPGSFVHIIMGHLAMDSFWEQALHQNSAFIFNLALARMDHVVVTTVPYQIHHGTNGDDEKHDTAGAEIADAADTVLEGGHPQIKSPQ